MTTADFDQFRSRLREVVKIVDLLESTGHHIRRNSQGGGTTRCPFHDDHRPSFSVYVDKEGVERFRCWSCNPRGGDVFEFARLQSGDPDHLSTLRRLAEKYQIPWPETLSPNGHKPNDVIPRAARFYQRGLTKPVLDYLAGRGFPEAFVKERQIGYVPVGTEGTTTRLADEAKRAGVLEEALAAKLVVKYRNGRLRDWFWSDARGYSKAASRTWVAARYGFTNGRLEDVPRALRGRIRADALRILSRGEHPNECPSAPTATTEDASTSAATGHGDTARPSAPEAEAAESVPPTGTQPATANQLEEIRRQCTLRGIVHPEHDAGIRQSARRDIDRLEDLTQAQADRVIRYLKYITNEMIPDIAKRLGGTVVEVRSRPGGPAA